MWRTFSVDTNDTCLVPPQVPFKNLVSLHAKTVSGLPEKIIMESRFIITTVQNDRKRRMTNRIILSMPFKMASEVASKVIGGTHFERSIDR